MNRSLRSLCRPLAALRSAIPARTVFPGHNLIMAHLSTEAMAHASALNAKPNTWQGAGAAEFDLRSKLDIGINGL